MKNTSTASNKYRPVLTAEQIEHILLLAKSSPMTDTNISLIGSLSPFFAKIQNKAVEPAYATTEKSSKFSIESLGGNIAAQTAGVANSEASKEDHWLWCYDKLQSVGAAECNLGELDAANEHRYLHDLMTDEEKSCFEGGI